MPNDVNISSARLDEAGVGALQEAAVRSDGSVLVRLITSGWGTSGYYPQEVLERDIPRTFPPGTHMYWNHPTRTEERERPEGDLRNLAGTISSEPIWLEEGPVGPGMYADAAIRPSFIQPLEEIAQHIGLSIRGGGEVIKGEAEGREGRIVKKITEGKSVDFVTLPGAGGRIVQLFEAARNKEDLEEARNIGEWLESRLHLRLTKLADDMFGDGIVSREERIALSGAIGRALDAYHGHLMEEAPGLFARDINEEVNQGEMMESNDDTPEENDMSQEQINGLQESLQEAQSTINAQAALIAKLQERDVLRQARDFVAGKLAEAELPKATRGRLLKWLAADPPLTESGELDTEAYAERIEASVTEAQAEVAELLGQRGQITGMGESGSGNGSDKDAEAILKEAQERQEAAFSAIGFGGNNGD